MGLRRRALGGYDRGKMAHRLSGAGTAHHGADILHLLKCKRMLANAIEDISDIFDNGSGLQFDIQF